MKKFFQFAINIFIALAVLITSLNFAQAAKNLHIGAGIYQLAEPTGKTQDPINIYYYRPKNWRNGDKIFVAFHGSNRLRKYLIKGLRDKAEEKNVLIISPNFTQDKYPGNKYYNYGNVMNNGTLKPKEEWTFNAVNRIIDDVKKRTGADKSKVIFFGHSAGAQIMHRYLFFADEIKADKVIAANAGRYILPDENLNFPYGFKNIPIGEKELRRAYEKKLIVLIGENDTIRSKSFPHSAQDDNLGLNRLERGKNFYAISKSKAKKLGVKFNWRLVTVPNVGHNGLSMAKAALKYLD